MREYLSLTKVLLKNSSGGGIEDGKGRKKWIIFIGVCLAIGFIPMLVPLYALYDMLIQQTAMMNQSGTILALSFCMSAFMSFFFSLFLIPGVFYYSKDVQTLLYLPLKPETILASKFTVCLLFEYAFEAFITFPAIYAYMTNDLMTPLFMIIFILVFLTLPILPLIYSSLITMLIMRFIPFFKDRDKFNLLSGMIGVIFGVGLSMFMQNLNFSDPQQMIDLILSGKDSLIQVFAYLFPTITFATHACVDGDIVQLLFYLGITVAFVFAFLIIAKAFYFKGAIGISESKSSHKGTDARMLQKQTKKKRILISYMIKEVRLLLRTPIYFLNCVSIMVLLPAIMLFTMLTGQNSEALSSIPTITWNNDWLYSMALVGCALGILYSNLNSISATAISREGSNFVFMKYVPLTYRQQIYAKTLTGIVFSELGILIILIPAAIYLKMPILFFFVIFASSFIATIMGNFIGIIIDIIHPKLIWEHETAAVKQNLNSVIAILACMAIPFLLIFLLFKMDSQYWSYYSFGVLGIVTILTPLLYLAAGKLADKRFKNL